MTTPYRLMPQEARVGAVVSLHKLQGDVDDPEFIHQTLRGRLVPQVASLVAERVERTEHVESVDYRIDLYVLTPNELARLIQREAERFADLMGYRGL